MDKSLSRGLIILGVLLAIGMSAAAFIFGMQAKHIGSAKQTITVKGLAEQPIKATRAEWQITVSAHGESLQETLKALRLERAQVGTYLSGFGFPSAAISQAVESIEPNRVEITNEFGRNVTVQRGFNGSQIIIVKSNDLLKVQEALVRIIEFKALGHGVESTSVDFLVGNLDEIKLSLIGAATKNASARAVELAKNGDVKVGLMRSATQGTFDILSADGKIPDDNYGGSYDTSSINKIARVVVTIEYNIER